MVPVVVILIWLLASWSAPATQLALVASAGSVSPPRATVTAAYTSSSHTNAMIRLYVNGKRWGSSELAAGCWQLAGCEFARQRDLNERCAKRGHSHCSKRTQRLSIGRDGVVVSCVIQRQFWLRERWVADLA